MIRDVSRQSFGQGIGSVDEPVSSGGSSEPAAGTLEEKRQALETALGHAVESEDYERAAELRDALNRLQGE